MLTRRQFHRRMIAASAATISAAHAWGKDSSFRLNYMVASCMYGKMPLAEILPEVRKTGAEYIEIWAERHGNQREQIDEMGKDAFLELLKRHQVKLGGFTCFKFGIFNMQDEMRLVKDLGGDLVICNTPGP